MRGGVFMQQITLRKQKAAIRTRQRETWALLREIAVACLCCAALLGGLLAGLAALACRVDLPLHLMAPLAAGAACLAVMPSALLLAWLRGQNGMLSGLLFALGCFLLLWLIAILQGQVPLTKLAVLKALAMLCAGAMGGYLGISLREKNKLI